MTATHVLLLLIAGVVTSTVAVGMRIAAGRHTRAFAYVLLLGIALLIATFAAGFTTGANGLAEAAAWALLLLLAAAVAAGRDGPDAVARGDDHPIAM
jgi:hypothetical protein